MSQVIYCAGCGEQWDVDYDPSHCICLNVEDEDWILYVFD